MIELRTNYETEKHKTTQLETELKVSKDLLEVSYYEDDIFIVMVNDGFLQ